MQIGLRGEINVRICVERGGEIYLGRVLLVRARLLLEIARVSVFRTGRLAKEFAISAHLVKRMKIQIV